MRLGSDPVVQQEVTLTKLRLLKWVCLPLLDRGHGMTSLSKERAEKRDARHGEWLWKTEGQIANVICKVPPLSLSKMSLLSETSLNPQWISKCYTHPSRNHPARAGIQFTARLGSGTEKIEEFRTGNEWCHYTQFQPRRNFGRQIVDTQSRTGSWGYQAQSWKAPWILPSVQAYQWRLPPRYLSI